MAGINVRAFTVSTIPRAMRHVCMQCVSICVCAMLHIVYVCVYTMCVYVRLRL